MPIPRQELRRVTGHAGGSVSSYRVLLSIAGRLKDAGSSNTIVLRFLD